MYAPGLLLEMVKRLLFCIYIYTDGKSDPFLFGFMWYLIRGGSGKKKNQMVIGQIGDGLHLGLPHYHTSLF